MNYEEHFELSCKKREEFWNSLGKLYSDVIGNLINPGFMGGPEWPSLRQAHIGVMLQDSTIIATDGLSDPYDDFDSNKQNQSYNGLGLELYVITQNQYKDIPAIINSWEFLILRQVSNTSASNPNLINMLAEYQYISTIINGEGLPEKFVDDSGNAGVLLGLENNIVPGKLKLSIEEISLINVILLTTNELGYIMQNGVEGRIEIAEKLLKKGYNTLTTERPSVI